MVDYLFSQSILMEISGLWSLKLALSDTTVGLAIFIAHSWVNLIFTYDLVESWLIFLREACSLIIKYIAVKIQSWLRSHRNARTGGTLQTEFSSSNCLVVLNDLNEALFISFLEVKKDLLLYSHWGSRCLSLIRLRFVSIKLLRCREVPRPLYLFF